ncbi:hypothetical protein GS399_05340 [Pedobacter sp. HMF7647]|uniref:Cell wall anchor protein n=1 Tax=Hufsiella arboris TaxID=2695275 RepID=A0A7K1Y8I2_9SPHI|nr:tail fiber protein [Hufsiella arboris]MXV50389.1 hypothetical protein [Hufsiella arboris]
MKRTLIFSLLLASGRLAFGQDAVYNRISISDLEKSGGAATVYGWGNAASNLLDPRPYYSPGAPPFMINHHTGLTLSAHSLYGGIRFYNQGYPGAYDAATGANFVMSITDGRVGIGTTTPTIKLHVVGQGTTARFESSAGGAAIQIANTGNGRTWAIGDYVEIPGSFSIGYNMTNSRSGILIDGDGNIGIGTQSPDAKLAVSGRVHAQEVKVDANVPAPDYVFDKDYSLGSLTELHNYIREHRHLPEIPSAGEMAEKGLELGDMNLRLLKKIEELTLYIIELDKDKRETEDRNQKRLLELTQVVETLQQEVGELKKQFVK